MQIAECRILGAEGQRGRGSRSGRSGGSVELTIGKRERGNGPTPPFPFVQRATCNVQRTVCNVQRCFIIKNRSALCILHSISPSRLASYLSGWHVKGSKVRTDDPPQ